MRPFGSVSGIVAQIEWLRASTRDRKLASIEVALVRQLQQRALGTGEVGKFRGGESDEWDVAGMRDRICAVCYRSGAKKKRTACGKRYSAPLSSLADRGETSLLGILESSHDKHSCCDFH